MVQIYLSQGYEKKNRCHMFQNPGCPGSPSAGRPSGSIDEILSRPERDSSVDRCTMLLPTEENINEEGFPSKPPSHNDKDKEIPEKETLSHITHVRVNRQHPTSKNDSVSREKLLNFKVFSGFERTSSKRRSQSKFY